MGMTEDLRTISKEDLDDVIKKEKSFKEEGYRLYDSKSYITKASKNDLLNAIKAIVDSDSFSNRKFQEITSIDDLGTKIYINIKWLQNILFVALIDSSEGTVIVSELFTKSVRVPDNSLCKDIISKSLNELNLDEESKSFKSGARKEGVKSAAKYGVSEIIKCIVGIFIVIIIGAIIKAIFSI